MKKKIVSKTVLFILILIYIITFKIIFGQENTLIGVTTITAMLMFLERDLTLAPIKNTINLVALNIFIGIASFIASTNMFIAVPINFLAMFVMSYFLCFNLRNPMYLPFSLQYLFLLTAPVDISLQPRRFLALVIGAISIMVLQLIFNRNKVAKTGSKILVGVCDNISSKIAIMQEGKDTNDVDGEIYNRITSFRNILFDKRDSEFYLTEEGRINLNLSVALEKIALSLSKVTYNSETSKIIDFLNTFIQKSKLILESDESVALIENSMENFIAASRKEELEDIVYMKIINNMFLLIDSINELKSLDKKQYNKVNKLQEVPEDYKKSKILLRELTTNSLKFCYAVRVAIGITIGGFIMDYFNLSEGRWILFTILSVVNPLYEVAKEKTKHRIVSTIIGSIIIIILFTIFKDVTIRTLILMLSGYIGSYITKYKYNMICVTVSAIGAAALTDNVSVLSANRILFVVLGAMIAILINKFVLPYKLEDSNKYLKNTYDKVIDEMLKGVYLVMKGEIASNRIKNAFLFTSTIEDKLRANNQVLINENNYEFIKEHRFLVINLYELYLWIDRNKIEEADIEYVVEDMRKLVERKDYNTENAIKEIMNDFEKLNSMSDKVLLCIIIEILAELENMKKVA